MACTWFGEISSCSWLIAVPGPAWVQLSKICKPFAGSLYTYLAFQQKKQNFLSWNAVEVQIGNLGFSTWKKRKMLPRLPSHCNFHQLSGPVHFQSLQFPLPPLCKFCCCIELLNLAVPRSRKGGRDCGSNLLRFDGKDLWSTPSNGIIGSRES